MDPIKSQSLDTLWVRNLLLNEKHGLIAILCIVGAAIALLDSVYLSLHIPRVTFTTIGYGMPRVSFADPMSMVIR